MIVGFISRHTLVNICLKSLWNEIFDLLRRCLERWIVKMVLSLQHAAYNFWVGLSLEWRPSTHHDVQDNTHGPNITLDSVLAFQDFWGNVVCCSIWIAHDFILWQLLSQSKINQFYVVWFLILVEQEVLWLYITMANPVIMQIFQSWESLPHNKGCFTFRKMFWLLLNYEVEQFSSFAIFCR